MTLPCLRFETLPAMRLRSASVAFSARIVMRRLAVLWW